MEVDILISNPVTSSELKVVLFLFFCLDEKDSRIE
jgi:hypothetical protein